MPLVTIDDLWGPPDEVAARIQDAKQLFRLYEEYIRFQPDDSVRPPGIHSSELSRCVRWAFYSLVDHRKIPTTKPFWKKKFKLGKAIHSMIERDFAGMAARTRRLRRAGAPAGDGFIVEFQANVLCSPELQPLCARWNIWSEADGVFVFREHAYGPAIVRVGLETKSMGKEEFAALRTPEPEHVEQVHTYMAALELPLMWLVYYCKGTDNITPSEAPFLLAFDPVVWAGTEAKIRLVHEHAARGEAPPRQESIACDFCPYAWDCQPTRLAGPPRRQSVVHLRTSGKA
ncbi:hypothetical protein LVJ94_35025 [Pendulispora rubella]|uniref:PD-(D/E)XK endonuclease-like domain-containing protein n=1 Tax=Pendulispora rubella TaxID=2741070 RepID=A0ABZ2KYP5_9BACT